MPDARWTPAAVTGRHLIIALGALYVALAALFPFLQTGAALPLEIVVIVSLLTATPGAVLFLGGYLLPRTDVHVALYDRIAGWCLAAAGVMAGILLLIAMLDSLTSILYNVLILTALSSSAGFGIGLYDAKSRTRALEAEQRNRELAYQNNRLENFARMLAHELRNPLTIAQGYHEQSRPRNEDAAEKVARAHERIEGMIDILLITVRGSNVDATDTQVAIGELAPSVWEDLSMAEGAATLEVETGRTVQCDPVHLQHLLANLFRNSIEHAEDTVAIRVGDLDDGFYVEDSGPGIPEEIRDDVVEAGFTTRKHGTGLGLTVVTQLADVYDWDWTLTESASGGARFEFTGVESVDASARPQRPG